MRHPSILCCLAVAVATPVFALPPERVRPADIQPEKSLLITHPAVVDSELAQYPGPWAFGTLMEQIFGKEEAPAAVHKWLECYYLNSRVGVVPDQGLPGLIGAPALTPRSTSMPGGLCLPTVAVPRGSGVIPARPDIARKFILPWQKKDGYDPSSGKPWKPNLANAPFRLLAIVNRMDLGVPGIVDLKKPLEERWKLAGKENEFTRMVSLASQGDPNASQTPVISGGYGGFGAFVATEPENFGEGRLVFGAVDPDGKPLEGGWTLIFEYKLKPLAKATRPKAGNKDEPNQHRIAARDWARAWHWLGGMEITDPRFAPELARITQAFTHRHRPEKTDSASEPAEEAPAFSQLRSSEAAFGPGREFRQFEVGSGGFAPASLPLTPAPEFMEDTREGGRLLSAFLRDIEPLIKAGAHSIPGTVTVQGKAVPFLASHAVIPAGEKDFHWDPKPRIPRDSRRLFSMNTCNGCHAGDTGCPDGMHVHPRAAGEMAKLSDFLRTDGNTNRIPDPGVKSSSVRLAEIGDRAAILAALLEPKESKRLDALAETLRDRLSRSH